MAEQLTEAALLLGVGMAVVFAFLVLLIGGIQVIAAYVRAFPGESAEQNNTTNTPASPSTTELRPDLVAAISAAVHAHRHTNK
ncbi:OadG family protein [Agaribacter marinus]|uniref:Probable oxaloacetate decarboxylase gamma chain n=1 Tax=Agaribacter marinus TaxID=1431249 RepID=A0AA37SZ76_9ALTE|nr:OadG family transporter subunit [Agaribacter marinus]GLR70676.1 putative oxaloacetate decarboxylase gamma chain 1 [Agaribacter marinus]